MAAMAILPEMGRGRLAVLVVALVLAGCAPRLQPPGPEARAPELAEDRFITADGLALPLRVWPAAGPARAVIVGLHGFGDYSRGFDSPARWWAERGITTYAYDQRGFGATPYRGIWPGVDRLTADLRDMVALVRERHPGLPIYVVGVSMGGAVAMAALAREPPPVAGAVLSAPAVWGRETMNPIQRAVLWLAAHTMPWNYADARDLNIRPSDNIEMLRALARDPLVYKRSRIDMVYGMVDLMDAALAAAPKIETPLLLLYGTRDEVIPKKPIELMLGRLRAPRRVALYDEGWHLLLRDLGAERVWRDVAAWIADPEGPLPSGRERRGSPLFAGR